MRAALRTLQRCARLACLGLPALCLTFSCQGPGPVGALPEVGDWVTVPAEFEDDYFFLPLILEGQSERVLWFLFDTGAGISVIDPDSLERVSDWQRSSGTRVSFPDLQCGPVHLHGVSAKVQELDHLQNTLGHSFDGILGYRAFAKVLLNLDYPAGVMRVAQGTLPRPDGVSVFALHGEGRPHVDFQLAGRKHRLLIDSGAGARFKLHPHSSWDWAVEPRAVGSFMGIDGLKLQRAGRLLEGGEFLGVSYPQPLIYVVSDTQLVGTGVLRDLSLTFDQQTCRLHIIPPAGREVAPRPLRGTGAIFGPLADGREVIQVLPGSSAERAGLRVGDEVELLATRDRTGIHGGDARRYRVRRGAQRFELRVPLEDLVP